MPWVAPQIGIYTRLGYAYCMTCAERLQMITETKIYGDTCDTNDSCDQCSAPFKRVPSSEYVQVPA